MTIEYVRKLSADEERAKARDQVASAAGRGEAPSTTFPAADLRWCFRGHEDKLAELEQIAAAERERQAERRRQLAENETLERETERVLREIQTAEVAERRKRAEQIARERLGLEAKT